MPVQIWSEELKIIDIINLSCTKAFSQTINNAAAVTADGGTQTTIAITTHGYLAGSYIYITGSVAYDGLHKITAVATSTITIQAPFVAETFAGTETTRFAYKCPVACEMSEFRIHWNAAPTTAENIVITIDDARGSAYDTVICTQPVVPLTDFLWIPDYQLKLNIDDIIVATFANTDLRTLGAEMKIRRIAKPGVVFK
jgi:hypothetical protein